MLEFFNNYPIIKWALVGLGVVAIILRYIDIPFLKRFSDRNDTYTFEEINHLNNPVLKELIKNLNQHEFDKVNQSLKQLQESYRSFAFRALGQYGDTLAIERWINEEPQNGLPLIVKAYRIVWNAWEIRGRHSIDTVSATDLTKFKELLHDAKKVLYTVDSDTSYSVHVQALLLKIFKALDTERHKIRSTYLKAAQYHTNHAELNFNYFSAISPKWGGTRTEIDEYFSELDQKSDFINVLIRAQYYFDAVHMAGATDETKEINSFIENMKSFKIEENELYKYEFYLLLYWLSNNLEYKALEQHYKQLIQPFWRD